MNNNVSVPETRDRRTFLKMLSGGSLLCLGCGLMCGAPRFQESVKAEVPVDKFKEDSRMSMERVFDFAYNELTWKVKLLAEIMSKDIGREKFLDYLRQAGIESGRIEGQKAAAQLGRNDLEALTDELRRPAYIVNHLLTYDIVRDTPKAFEVKIKECLWAKTFIKNNAADIGHAMFCNRDFITAKAFNPRITLTRTKTLMQGNDYCNHIWTIED